MNVPENLFYTREHEWIKIEGKSGTVGISDYAQDSLGDITFVELPKIDAVLKEAGLMASIESVKAASDIYAPMTGKVVKVNNELANTPEIINQSPYDKGWLVVIALEDENEKSDLMSAAEYKEYLEELSK